MPCLTFAETCLTHPDTSQLIAPFSATLTAGATGLVGRNGAGKSTLLRAVAGLINMTGGTITASDAPRLLHQGLPFADAQIIDLFGLRAAHERLQRALEGQVEDMDLVDWTLEERIGAALNRVGLDVPVGMPLTRLSGGQRRRAALAAVFFDAPPIVLLDEPSNDLDETGRAQLFALLDAHRGLALVASHDRALLDRMDIIMDLTEQGVRLFHGGWTAYAQLRAGEKARAAAEVQHAQAGLRETRRQVAEAQARRERRARQGKALRADGSQPKMLLDMAKEGAEARQAGQARLAARQIDHAETRLDAARAALDRAKSLAFDLPATGLPAGRDVLGLRDVSFHHPGAVSGPEAISFEMRGPERVRLAGGNGAGKSTLLKLITGDLTPTRGSIARHVPVAYLDQHLHQFDNGRGSVLDHARATLPELEEEALRALLARFLFRNSAALAPVAQLSGGERLRLGLALALGCAEPAQLLLLDEPTNHLDLDAVAAVEQALLGYDGALIVVTHDTRFAKALGLARELTFTGDGHLA